MADLLRCLIQHTKVLTKLPNLYLRTPTCVGPQRNLFSLFYEQINVFSPSTQVHVDMEDYHNELNSVATKPNSLTTTKF